jgi:hypothetical protein
MPEFLCGCWVLQVDRESQPPCALQAVAGPDLPVAALWVDSGPGDRLTLCVSLPHLQASDAAIDSRWDLVLSP